MEYFSDDSVENGYTRKKNDMFIYQRNIHYWKYTWRYPFFLKYRCEEMTNLCSIMSHYSCGIGDDAGYVVVLQTQTQTHVPRLRKISATLQNHSGSSGKDVDFHHECHTILWKLEQGRLKPVKRVTAIK